MKHRAMRLLHAGLAAVLAASGPEAGIAAEGQAAQELASVWILKADGTQILPAGYSCTNNRASIDVQYRFPVDDSADAVAAAVRIDSDFFIEKLQPLMFTPAADDQAR